MRREKQSQVFVFPFGYDKTEVASTPVSVGLQFLLIPRSVSERLGNTHSSTYLKERKEVSHSSFRQDFISLALLFPKKKLTSSG